MCVSLFCLFFFFFKQKTAYEMRISDWSSDVCSSDLMARRYSPPLIRRMRSHAAMRHENGLAEGRAMGDSQTASHVERWSTWDYAVAAAYTALLIARSEESRVGKECVISCRSRWSPYI